MWYPNERTNIKAIDDEHDVLTDDELVVVRLLNYAWGDYFKLAKKTHLNLHARCYGDGRYRDCININHECTFIERYIYSGLFEKKELFSRFQAKEDTWEQDNFEDCCYNIMVLVKRQIKLS